MVQYAEVIYCDGCGVEIIGAPVVNDGGLYCCQDCAHGLECDCKPEVEIDLAA